MTVPNARKATTRRKPAPKPPSDAAVAAGVILAQSYPPVDAVGIRWTADDPIGYGLAAEWASFYAPPKDVVTP